MSALLVTDDFLRVWIEISYFLATVQRECLPAATCNCGALIFALKCLFECKENSVLRTTLEAISGVRPGFWRWKDTSPALSTSPWES